MPTMAALIEKTVIAQVIIGIRDEDIKNKAMPRLAEMLGKKTEAAEYRQKTDQLRN
jgi:hypothetical protein